MRKHKAFGVEFEESEIISSNDQFLTDGSGSFRSLDNAMKHYDELSVKFVCDLYVEQISHPNTELIAECQPVEDNVL